MKNQDWAIRKCGEACSVCGRPFDDQQPFHSILTFDAKGYHRWDCCEACRAQADTDGALSLWRGRFQAPPAPREEPVRQETAESLLRRYMEIDDPARHHVIFILAVMLERKRILREREVREREDGILVRVYEHAGSGEVFLIPDPRLKLSQVQEIREEVLALLKGPA